ncbi:outer membrane protein assembly factor [Lysobacter sp. K5869]|uniref:autotransporter assembly complex protein TamA n=1 Tax=Lysobacter sp. K5869 TaxID=2820808 RepID=UPI001C05FCDD|nr:autotransporter assembly complex family protein [Lysobacter sp. K5869]QWP77398.1 outer membrane protein assembly factor [Lysobacter sp. K5869]
MPLIPRLFLAGALSLGAAGAAQAAKVDKVEIHGLDEAMTQNVRVSLSLVDSIGKEVSGRRLGYLLREAENETREALEPFGYYSPTIKIVDSRGDRVAAPAAGDDPNAPGERDAAAAPDAAPASASRANSPPISVTISVDKGEPVKVRRSDIAVVGAGSDDRYLKQDLAAFRPGPDQVFEHAAYEASKTKISRRLAERGYFDADFSSRRVEVTRAEHAADIDLVWTSGQRYDMGAIGFEQTPKRIIRDSLLQKLVYWEQGSYYHQGKLDRFRESLARLDYFSSIDIEPLPDQATDGQVPVKVTLTPAKRSIYTAGVSYGTDSGAGVRLGVERRYVNDRGHKALAQIDFAQRRKTATLQYRIPAFAWLDGWYTFSLQGSDEQTDYIDSRRIELVASRSGKIDQHWTATASLHGLSERWAYYDELDGGVDAREAYRTATFLYPSLRAEYVDVDDKLYPRSGISATGMIRGGLKSVGSDANFLQAHVTGRWFKGLGERSRLIARGEIGHTFTSSLTAMPPSLRFYAGGDRSIRGYEWREVGPRIPAGDGRKAYALGAKNVVTSSLEYEQYFNESWGGAVFVDSGSAFDDQSDFKMRTGVGFGVRWRSPVGPLRIDIARGLDDPDSGFQLYLNIGADL